MAMSYVDYTGDGSTTDFTVTFPFLNRSDVSLTVDGETATFTWVSDAMIRATTAPANGDAVRIARTTNITNILVDFTHGARLSEEDLDVWTKQLFYAIQEAVEGRGFDAGEDGMLVQDTMPTLGGDLDLNGYNVGSISPTELGYLSGVTSAIQTQINDLLSALSNLAHSDLSDDEAEKHRTINDSGTDATDLWSASKIITELGNKSDTSHNHDSAYSATTHNHDEDYAAIGHNHDSTYAATTHNHDSAYAAASHGHNHADLSNIPAAKHREITYGTSAPGSATGKADGSIYIQYEA